ncbi:hypothetical protein [Microtetraspora malaysiensis]|uniref:Uncharacterized protein n=1 Tax=Microtetraspora malaysiensis TaxID=161358 RepID=A0ABW6SNT5_9ACTN
MRITVCHNLDRAGDRYMPGDRLAAVYTSTLPRRLTATWAVITAEELFRAFRTAGPCASLRPDERRAVALYQAAGLRIFSRGDVLLLDRWAFTWCAYGVCVELDAGDLTIVRPLPTPPARSRACPQASALNAALSGVRRPALPTTPALAR